MGAPGPGVGLAAILVLAGELLLPTSGIGGLAGRMALWLAYPLLLWATGFLNDEEREAAGRVLRPSYVKASLQRLRDAPPPEPASEADAGGGPRDGAPPTHPGDARGRAARRGRDSLVSGVGLEDLTVLICTHNKARLLDRALESVADQVLPLGGPLGGPGGGQPLHR